ncbi:MAG TPA: hypothetical protein VGP63_21335 [Planctomycetaceae bacterium]|jgi:hypothetical protein|nr:hypothetical protein [Planctomycetaceae bacterium]
MSPDSRDEEDADFARAAREPQRKAKVRPVLFTLVVMAATLLAGFPVAMVFEPESPEKFGRGWYWVTLAAGIVAFMFFERIAVKERRLLRQKPDFGANATFDAKPATPQDLGRVAAPIHKTTLGETTSARN